MIKYLSAQLGYSDTPLRQAFDLTYVKRHQMVSAWGIDSMAVGLSWIYAPGTNGEINWHTGGTGGYKTYVGFNRSTSQGIVILSTGARPTELGFYLSGISDTLSTIKKQLATELWKKIDNEGVKSAEKFFSDSVVNNLHEFDYDEGRINLLGYNYLDENVDASLTVFEINIRLFPDVSNPYDSYGEALRKKGQLEESLKNYRKSVELDPENQHGLNMIGELENELEIDPN